MIRREAGDTLKAILFPFRLSCCLCCCCSCQHICSPPPWRAPTASSPSTATIRRTHAFIAPVLWGSPSYVHLSINSSGGTLGQGSDGTTLHTIYWWLLVGGWDPKRNKRGVSDTSCKPGNWIAILDGGDGFCISQTENVVPLLWCISATAVNETKKLENILGEAQKWKEAGKTFSWCRNWKNSE